MAQKSTEQLESEIQALMREEDAIRDKKAALKAALDEKAAQEKADAVLAGLSPSQIDAIASAAAARASSSAKNAG